MLTASTNVVMTPCAGRDSAGLTTMTPLNTSPVVRGFGRFVAPIANLQIALVDGFLAAGTTWSRRKETWVRRQDRWVRHGAILESRESILFQDQANHRRPEVNRCNVEADRGRLDAILERVISM